MKGKIRISSQTSEIRNKRKYSKQYPRFILDYMKQFGDACFEVCTDCVDQPNRKNNVSAELDNKCVSVYRRPS